MVFGRRNHWQRGRFKPVGCYYMLFLGAAVALTGYWTIREVRFLIGGQKVTATVNDVREVHSRRSEALRVYYTFRDSATGEERFESDQVDDTWPSIEETVLIEHVPKVKNLSRLAGNHEFVPTALFFVFAAWLIVLACVQWRAFRAERADSRSILQILRLRR